MIYFYILYRNVIYTTTIKIILLKKENYWSQLFIIFNINNLYI